MMTYSSDEFKKDLVIIIPPLLKFISVLAVLWIVCHCAMYEPLLEEKEISDSENITKFAVSLLTSTVSMVGLIISLLGVFITMLVITVGNYRQQFYDIFWKLIKDDNIKYIDERRLDILISRHEKLNTNAIPLQRAFKYFISFAIITLGFCCIFVIFQEWIFNNAWIYMWMFVSIFALAIFLMTANVCRKVLNVVSYPDMKEIQECIGDEIIVDLRKRNQEQRRRKA